LIKIKNPLKHKAQTDRIKYKHTQPISPERSDKDDGDVLFYSLQLQK